MVNVKNKKITFLLFFVFQFSFLIAQINNESSNQGTVNTKETGILYKT